MSRHTAPRALIVGFDGLRPDLVRADLTPNLARLQQLGVTFSKHRTVYPSETRVAFTSLVTGTPASAHGLVGNRYLDRTVHPPRYVDTADAILLETLDRENGGALLTATSLGEILAAAGRSMAVISSNSRGAARLLNHKARALGHICLSGHFADIGTPEDVVRTVEAQLGPPPPETKPEPALEAQSYVTTAFLDHVWPRVRPDVTILFYGEPDVSSHFNGILAPETRSAIGFTDRQFGRVLDWWEAEGRDAGVQLFIISDHGHVTQHTRVSVADALRDAGFSPGSVPQSGVDAVIIPGQVGAIYLDQPSEAAITRVVAALMEQEWCGCLFTAGRNEVEGLVPGTFATRLVMADHSRAPDVQFAFRTDDRLDRYGLVGRSFFDNDRPAGTGVHGGLHPKELAAVAIAAGSAFRGGGFVSISPSGICDVAPTLLQILGLSIPATVSGRILHEALSDASAAAAGGVPEPEVFETGSGSYVQAVRRVAVSGTVYVDGGWAGSAAGSEARNTRMWG